MAVHRSATGATKSTNGLHSQGKNIFLEKKAFAFTLVISQIFFFFFITSRPSPLSQVKNCIDIAQAPKKDNIHGTRTPRFPQILHFLWPNKDWSYGNEDPNGIAQQKTQEIVQIILTNNPAWKVKIWTDEDCDDLMERHFPEVYLKWTNLTPRLKMWDAVRPAILYVHGGIYLDHDIECDDGVDFLNWIAPPTQLLLREPTQDNMKLGNHFMGSCPRHTFWLLYMKNIFNDTPKNYSVGRHTGPRQLYPTFQEHVSSMKEDERHTIRLLGKHELDMKGECEKSQVFSGYCSRPRCSHTHTVSPAELKGEDDNPEKQVTAFTSMLKRQMPQRRLGYHYVKCGCRRLNGLQQLSQEKELDHTIIYIHIPKTGGTTIERKLGLNKSCHATASDMYRCNPPDYSASFAKGKVYTTFRHPVDRAVSAYRYAKGDGNGSDHDIEKFAWVRNLSFASFVTNLESRLDVVNFAPQLSFLQDVDGDIIVNKVLCTEHLSSIWDADLGQRFGKITEKYNASPFTNVVVTNDDVQRLKYLYANDFVFWDKHCQNSVNADASQAKSRALSLDTTTSSDSRRIIWFLHFHKAAGSSFTDLADLNRESKLSEFRDKHRHGHIDLDAAGKLRWPLVSDEVKQGMKCIENDGNADRISWIKDIQQKIRRGISFVSSEHYFPRLDQISQQEMPPNVKFVTIFREPSERLLSSYYYHKCASRCPDREYKNETCRLIEWSRMEENMYTRILNGLPFGPMILKEDCTRVLSHVVINQTHVDSAVRSLSRFDLILTLESFKLQPDAVKCALNRVLGWNSLDFPHENKGDKQQECPIKIGSEKLVPSRHEEWELIGAIERNSADVEIYKQASKLEKNIFERLKCF